MTLFLFFGCPAEDSAPAESCDPLPSAAWSGGEAFVEKTSEWGLDGVTGGLLQSGDLDGDGWPDLVVTEVFDNAADDPDNGVWYHRILLNREAPAGGRSFVDHTLDSGFLVNRDGGVGHAGNVQTLGDVDNDGDLDLFSGRYRAESTVDAVGTSHEIYLNDGAAHFTLKSDAGLWEEDPYPMMAGVFVDLDVDGVLDLFWAGWYDDYGVSMGSAEPRAFRGEGDGSFVEKEGWIPTLKSSATISAYIQRDRRRPAMGATACDVNGDSLPDLIQSNYGRAWNFLFLNEGGALSEVGEAAGVDADDNLDFTDNLAYACYCSSHDCDPAPTESCGGAFPDDYWYPGFDDQEARLAGNTFTSVCGDIDNDGDNDILHTEIAHSWAGQSSDPSQLLLNDGSGVFTRLDNEEAGLDRKRRGDWNEGDIWGNFADFDNDGWQDVWLVSTDYPDSEMHLFRQVAPASFEEVSEETGMNQEWPYGISTVDFDGDGDLDVITGSSTARDGTPWTDHQLHFYENQLGGNWIRIAGLPIGTAVELSAGGVTQRQEVSGGFGRGSIQNDLALHFGLGDVCMVDSVVVTKPGGASQSWEGLAGNQTRDLAF